MDTKRFELFVKVVDERTFGQAADALSISQPALSQQISKLEREVGAQLLDRSTRPFEMTHVGKEFYSLCRGIAGALDDVEGLISGVKAGQLGTIRVGLVPSLMYGPVLALIKSFLDARPEVEIEISYDPTAILREHLAEGRLDVALLYSIPNHKGLRHVKLGAEPYMAVVNSDHALAAQQQITFQQLAGEVLITIPREAAPENHDALVVACTSNGFSPAGITAPGSYLAHVGLVSAGLGISFIPKSVARLDMGNVVYKKLVSPEVNVETYACWHEKRYNAITEAFIDHLGRAMATEANKADSPINDMEMIDGDDVLMA